MPFLESSTDTQVFDNGFFLFRYQVFQRITENVNAAMLHFQSPVYPDLAVQSFMTYLHSFISLFNDKCKQCGCHLKVEAFLASGPNQSG